MNYLDISFMNAAMYLRKSRADENNPHETLERHKEILLNYAAEHNLNILDIYEEVISGGLLFNRAEINKLLEIIPTKRYDAVLCIDLDRLGRGSAADSERIFDVLKENDIKIITLKKVYDLNDEYDEDYSEFEMFMARKELKFISRRMARGRKKSISEGCYLAGAPYGYRNAVINRKHTLEIYEPEAQYVRMIFDLYVNKGMGLTSISRQMERLGVLSKKNTILSRSQIGRIIKNHTYIGKIVWNKSKTVKGQKTQIPTNKDTWLYVDGLHESIIDEDLFYKAQEIIKGKYKPPTNNGILRNPLSGLVKCANCGKTMVLGITDSAAGRYYRLICNTIKCNKGSKIDFIEHMVFNEVQKELKNMEATLAGDDNSDVYSEKNTYIKTINNANAELDKLNSQQTKLYDLLEQGIYSKEVFIERRDNIQNRMEKLKSIISESNERLDALDNTELKNKIPLFRDLIANYNSYDARQKNTILKNIISRIDYRRDKSAPEDDVYIKVHFI